MVCPFADPGDEDSVVNDLNEKQIERLLDEMYCEERTPWRMLFDNLDQAFDCAIFNRPHEVESIARDIISADRRKSYEAGIADEVSSELEVIGRLPAMLRRQAN